MGKKFLKKEKKIPSINKNNSKKKNKKLEKKTLKKQNAKMIKVNKSSNIIKKIEKNKLTENKKLKINKKEKQKENLKNKEKEKEKLKEKEKDTEKEKENLEDEEEIKIIKPPKKIEKKMNKKQINKVVEMEVEIMDKLYDSNNEKEDFQKGSNEPETNKTNIILKNGAAVDINLIDSNLYTVVQAKPSQYKNKFFSCILIYADLKKNSNKFYIIQLLKRDNFYYLFLRWGRVGRVGLQNLIPFNNFEDAYQEFMNKYNKKTEYGYQEISIDYERNEDINDNNNSEDIIVIDDNSEEVIDSKLKKLIELIYDLNFAEEQIKAIGYDNKRLPLGNLSDQTISEGYEILQELDTIIQKKEKKDNYNRNDLEGLTEQYYKTIPHNFGFCNMSNFIIDSSEKLEKEIELIENIKNIKVTSNIIQLNSNNKFKDKLFTKYNELNCIITSIEKDNFKYDFISKYLNSSTKIEEAPKFIIMGIYELNKENKNYKSNLSNKKYLWYGTNLSNYVPLLKDGFKLPPIEAPKTAYNFGKGIYFSDMSIKSYFRCKFQNGIGLMMLCEVALGDIEERNRGDYNLPYTMENGKNSIKVIGINVPNELDNTIFDSDIILPLGDPIKLDNKEKKTFFAYNEYVVYDVNQIKMKYLVMFKLDNSNYNNIY